MKRINNLYDNMISYSNILFVFNKVKSKCHNKNKIMDFIRYKNCYLIDILEKLKSREYKFSNYHIFLIHEKKYRIIMSESVCDKIVNQMISYFILMPTFKCLIVENIALCEVESGKVINMLFNICNIDIELSRNIMYNKNIEKENRAIKWGALLDSDSTSDIDRIIGKDILSMEEKESLINTIKEVNNDKKILQEWMLEENARLSFEGEINTARREGSDSKEKELIISMLKKKWIMKLFLT